MSHKWKHTTGGWKCSRCGLYGGLKNWPEYAGRVECWEAHTDLSFDDIAAARIVVHDEWGRVFQRLAKGDDDV